MLAARRGIATLTGRGAVASGTLAKFITSRPSPVSVKSAFSESGPTGGIGACVE
jgi:hypothetical protein